MSTEPVLVVDDDPKIVELVRAYLQRAGYEVITAGDGDVALQLVEQTPPSLIVLDVMLPGLDGLLLTRHLRDSRNRVPILMMSARGRVDDRIRGLVEGADDYLAKPFSPAELVERVNAILRRSAPGAVPTAMLKHADLEVDLERREVRRGGEPIDLSDLEFRLLVAVIEAQGRVLTRNRLIETVYGMDRDVFGRTIDVAIRRLRAKLGDDSDSPRYIATVRGVGYRAAPAHEPTDR
ncbi:MAG: response regulator transcription factor [Candidatus Dormibacteraeota bacterium]|nr:response regulator transcription factor [Candidatus Dormibacteraeota bacterium]